MTQSNAAHRGDAILVIGIVLIWVGIFAFDQYVPPLAPQIKNTVLVVVLGGTLPLTAFFAIVVAWSQ